MKKTYMKPELMANTINVEALICLSIQESAADNSAVLVKERGSREEAIDADEVIDEINAADAEVTYGNLW
jgi:hypothetical protein